MKPLLANRLAFAYLATVVAAFIVLALLGALIGGFQGALLAAQGASQGASQEEIVRIVMERIDKMSDDLFHVAMAITMALLAFWIYRRYVVRWADVIRWRAAKLNDAAEISGWILLFGLGFTLFVGWIIPQEYIQEISGYYQAQTPWGRLALVLSVGLLAPLLEEWIFRGFMLQSYARRKGTTFALFAQALVFSMVHGEPFAAAGALFFGWILGRWVLAGGLLTSAFWAHALNNLLSLAGMAYGIPYLRPDTPAAAPLGLFGLVLAVFVLLQVARRTPYAERPAEEPGPVLSGSLVLVLFISVFLFVENFGKFLSITQG